jgi:TPR repeat protein
MANREELSIIRGARAGRAGAQVALGKLYLFGSTGLPRSLPTALHWLDRAAQQGSDEAWQLIGTHVPYELARQSARPLLHWYERAYDDGIDRAGLVLARMVLGDPEPGAAPTPQLQAKALQALESAARAGQAEAQWLLARHHGSAAGAAPPGSGPHTLPAAGEAAARHAPFGAGFPRPATGMASHGALTERGQAAASGPAGGHATWPAVPQVAGERWLRRAADNGVAPAQYALIERAWEAGHEAAFLACALPLARTVVTAFDAAGKGGSRLAPEEVLLLSRCAQAMSSVPPSADPDGPGQWQLAEQQRFWELAAQEHDRMAQLATGLWLARMEINGKRIAVGSGAANFKKAIRWLTLAGEQGLAEAWYALSRIYIKPEFSQRNVQDAQVYLERAAEMGYRNAQLECGNSAWRARRENESNDVRAVYWLQKAAAQQCPQAQAVLDKIAPRTVPADVFEQPSRELAGSHPLLAARLELAGTFGLSRAEALLLDVKAADRGHCLVVDIRSSYGRSKRRLVLLETAQERQVLDRIVRLFDNVDCGPNGPEGNYRQRLYRFKTLVGGSAGDGADAATDGSGYELAA